MENRRVPEYFNYVEPLINFEIPLKERMEQLERDLAENRWYMEWKVRSDRELQLTLNASADEWLEWENYDKHGILPTAYPEVVNGYPPRPIQYYKRKNRAIGASVFTNGYKFIKGLKCLISSGKPHPIVSGKCFDSTWVAVHGKDSVCVVTRRQIMDMTRLAPTYQEFSTTQIMCGHAEAIISLLECIPYDDSTYNDDDLRPPFGHMIEAPFSAVSVGLDAIMANDGSGHEQDISYEYDVTSAAMFLEEKIKSGLAFNVDETIQSAIIAFQHMCRWELKAEDLWVTYTELLDNCANHLILDRIKDHFTVINGSSCAVASPEAFFFGYHPIPSLKCDYESDNQPSQDFHPSLKCDYEYENQPSQDFLVSRFSRLSII